MRFCIGVIPFSLLTRPHNDHRLSESGIGQDWAEGCFSPRLQPLSRHPGVVCVTSRHPNACLWAEWLALFGLHVCMALYGLLHSNIGLPPGKVTSSDAPAGSWSKAVPCHAAYVCALCASPGITARQSDLVTMLRRGRPATVRRILWSVRLPCVSFLLRSCPPGVRRGVWWPKLSAR